MRTSSYYYSLFKMSDDDDDTDSSNSDDDQAYPNRYHRNRHRLCYACISRRKKDDKTQASFNTTIATRKGFSLGRLLELQSHLLEYIFKYLDFRSLELAKSVNITWKELAVRELDRRNTCSWITCVYTASLCNVQTSGNFLYNKPVFAILAYCADRIKLQNLVCADFERMTFGHYLDSEAVPYGMQSCVIGCAKVLPANIADKNASVLYQGIFIPNIPNAQIKPFHYNIKTSLNNRDRELINRDNEEVKCVLIFTRKYQPRKTRSLLSLLLDGRPSHCMALGGGLVKSSKLRPNYERFTRPDDLLCIAFVQNKSNVEYFNTYSVMVPEESSCDETDHYKIFENVLLKLKRTAALYKSGVIFHFCCFEKRFKDEEYALVKKHFPRYATFNIEVDGGIGWNSTRITESNIESLKPKRKKRKSSLPSILSSQSSVLVLVTWTEIVESVFVLKKYEQ